MTNTLTCLEKAFKTTFHKIVHFILAYIFAIFRPPGRAGRPLIKDYQRTEEHKGCLYNTETKIYKSLLEFQWHFSPIFPHQQEYLEWMNCYLLVRSFDGECRLGEKLENKELPNVKHTTFHLLCKWIYLEPEKKGHCFSSKLYKVVQICTLIKVSGQQNYALAISIY